MTRRALWPATEQELLLDGAIDPGTVWHLVRRARTAIGTVVVRVACGGATKGRAH